jgi:mRNA interferase RelE/StbE
MADTITITRDEYDRLRHAAEDLEDLRAYDRAKTRLASGEDELVPAEFARRIVAGESPLRVFRDWRGLTQARLAELAHVNRVQIADIEAGRKTGSVETVKRLAEALGVTVDELV